HRGCAARDRGRLRGCHCSRRAIRREATRDRHLVEVGRDDGEDETDRPEQLAPPGRAGREHERRRDLRRHVVAFDDTTRARRKRRGLRVGNAAASVASLFARMSRHLSLAMALALVLLIATLLLGWGIGGYVLYEPDEARHAEVAREMLVAPTWRDWIVPRLDGAPYLNKPAPFYWLMAGALAVFGVNEGAARTPSLLSALLVALATSLWGARRW